MKKIFCLSVFLFSFLSFGSEIPSWKITVKSFLLKMVDEKTVDSWLSIPQQEEIRLPIIPKVVKKASSSDSYKKTAIDEQGDSYHKLSSDKKRQFEFNYLQELSEVVFKTPPNEDELGKWMNVLDQGASREGVYRAMVLGEEYFSLENIEKSPSDQMIDYTIKFSERFLGKSWKKESLSKNNIYTIKRIITESGLEVMDELSKKPEDVYSWYAVFSSEMAALNGKLFVGKLRPITNVKTHFEWAQTAPYQHIKSEFIIKIHTILNSFDS